jgi:hypothetical protein
LAVLAPLLATVAIAGCVTDERSGSLLGQDVGQALGSMLGQTTGNAQVAALFNRYSGDIGQVLGGELANALNEDEQQAAATATQKALDKAAADTAPAADAAPPEPPAAPAPAPRSRSDTAAPSPQKAPSPPSSTTAAKPAPQAVPVPPKPKPAVPARRPLPPQEPEPWTSPTDPGDVSGSVQVVDQSVADDGRVCQVAQQVGYVRGQEIRDQIKYCQRPDGSWEPVEV